MALPKMNTAIYELTLPYSKKKVKYRPFIVGEQKLLYQALETANDKVMYNAMKEAIKSCSNNTIDPDQIPLFELEWLFLHLRMKSVGETTKVGMKCSNKECNHDNEVDIDLREVRLDGIEDIKDNVIFLNENIAVRLRLPTYDVINSMMEAEEEFEDQETGEATLLFKVISRSIEAILEKDAEYLTKDVPFSEVEEFVNNLTTDQFAMIQKFLDKVPQTRLGVKFKCTKCGTETIDDLRGLASFF